MGWGMIGLIRANSRFLFAIFWLAVSAAACAPIQKPTPVVVDVAPSKVRLVNFSATTERTSAHETAFRAQIPGESGHLDEALKEQGAILTTGAENGGWIEQQESYRHVLSGLTCAKSEILAMSLGPDGSITAYAVPLTKILVFDEAGMDTGCHYQDDSVGTRFTVYASKWPDVTLDEHYDSAKQQIAELVPVASVEETLHEVEDDDVDADTAAPDLPSSIEGPTREAVFVLQSESQSVTFNTLLWLNKTGDWHVKGRYSHPAALGFMDIAGLLAEAVALGVYEHRLAEVDLHINTVGAQTISYTKR